jgi:phenylpropionate dioxygenase-like ring-hydroxylating dioxygenase large terminal subunit
MIEYETAENASRAYAYAEPKAPQRANRYQYLTDTNPDTRAGKLLRQYWQPVALTADLPPAGPPLGVRIMGQDVVLFRDDAARVGALDRKCIHRCADLVLGRIENGGIRCEAGQEFLSSATRANVRFPV